MKSVLDEAKDQERFKISDDRKLKSFLGGDSTVPKGTKSMDITKQG